MADDEVRIPLMPMGVDDDKTNSNIFVAQAYDQESSTRKATILSHIWRRHATHVLVGLVALFMSSTLALALRLPCAFHWPNGPYSCAKSAHFDCGSVIPSHDVSADHSKDSWEFNATRDDRDYSLTHGQCEAAFPGLFVEIDEAVLRHRPEAARIGREHLDRDDWRPGTVRIMVYDGELFFINANWCFGHRIHATLHSLNRALSVAPEPLPNIEFVANDADYLDPALPYWGYTRKTDWNETWLMPDFGLYAWPEPGIGTYQEVRRRMRDADEPHVGFKDKIPKAFWRGNVEMGDLRQDLIRVSENKAWADVGDLYWEDSEALARDYVAIEDHCKYAILIHTEGESYSGRLKYLMNCPGSLLFIHSLQWLQPFEYLLVKSGPLQNYVEVARDFSDFEEKVQYFLSHPEDAEIIITNAMRTFRDRYVTPAATSCYWRRLIKGYAEVSDAPEFYEQPASERRWRGVPFESASLMGQLHWDIH